MLYLLFFKLACLFLLVVILLWQMSSVCCLDVITSKWSLLSPLKWSQPSLCHFRFILFFFFSSWHLLRGIHFPHKTCLFQDLFSPGGQRPCLTYSCLCPWCSWHTAGSQLNLLSEWVVYSWCKHYFWSQDSLASTIYWLCGFGQGNIFWCLSLPSL